MASGIVMGNCAVCSDLVWEDEWDFIDDQIIHEECRSEYTKCKYGMNEEQFLRLCGTSELRREILETIEMLKRDTGFYLEKLSLLESRLNELEKSKEESK